MVGDSDSDECPAIFSGSQLADELVESLAETPFSARNRMFVWLGLLGALRASCELQLGSRASAEIFQRVETTVRAERAKLQH